MEIPDLVEKVESGSRDPNDYRALRAYLQAPKNLDHLYSAIVTYAEHSPVVDWSLIIHFLRYPSDPLVSAGAINAGGLRRCPLPEFWDEVEKVAMGEDWDPDQDARVQAILALGSAPKERHPSIKPILRACLNDERRNTADCAAIAAQRCVGIPEINVIAGGKPGTVIERVGADVTAWLFAE